MLLHHFWILFIFFAPSFIILLAKMALMLYTLISSFFFSYTSDDINSSNLSNEWFIDDKTFEHFSIQRFLHHKKRKHQKQIPQTSRQQNNQISFNRCLHRILLNENGKLVARSIQNALLLLWTRLDVFFYMGPLSCHATIQNINSSNLFDVLTTPAKSQKNRSHT